jgi:hypothetical protein
LRLGSTSGVTDRSGTVRLKPKTASAPDPRTSSWWSLKEQLGGAAVDSLIARLVLRPRDAVVLENPTYYGAMDVFRSREPGKGHGALLKTAHPRRGT